MRKLLRWAGRIGFWIVMSAFIVTFMRDSTLPLGDQWTAVGVIARDEQFDYLGWEVNALATKLGESLYGIAPYLTETAQADTARAYMRDLGAARRLEGEISALYADPNVSDPAAASAEQRARRDALRADLAGRQPLVEAILERQVTAVLRDLGFAVGGVIVPPVSMHFTAVPNLLIVSPRDQIRFDISINLDPMPIDEIAALEDRIDTEQNVSSLIVPLGGIALYPAMILETDSIPFALETFAHEWLHHYLYAFPLGYNYDFAGETRIINESTAQQFGVAVGRIVLERYYPDLVPPLIPDRSPTQARRGEEMPVFDFGAAMRETRVTVDALLAAGRVADAETYMDERRRVFADNGYLIRKLNQAYFAFYGGYQSGSPGAGGGDPIGEAVATIRRDSASIHDWIVRLRGIVTREELLAAAHGS